MLSGSDAPIALCVAPFTGAWIEILQKISCRVRVVVAPFTGAWIEIFCQRYLILLGLSHPSRVRGLKSGLHGRVPLRRGSRTLHGCVD